MDKSTKRRDRSLESVFPGLNGFSIFNSPVKRHSRATVKSLTNASPDGKHVPRYAPDSELSFLNILPLTMLSPKAPPTQPLENKKPFNHRRRSNQLPPVQEDTSMKRDPKFTKSIEDQSERFGKQVDEIV